ncbi:MULTISPECIES: LysR family transcriptional regulator [unclassified Serratia (in: enterobacteria)]|uniref:LysR family transcriptional regulator n=1 Tax=unclassified Serratia (in: enterobacteria) TaxID=2647522 RepID=UPI00307634AE
MNFEDIHIFTTIVHAGSLTAAAEQLNLSKQFVSRRLAILEKSLSARLLVRNTRRLSVTDIGMVFFHQAQRVLDEVHTANQVISRYQKKLVGSFKISIPMTYGVKYISSKLIDFKIKNPELTLNIEMNDRFVDLIGEGFDLAIRIGNLKDSTLIARSLGALPMTLCASPDYLKSEGTPKEVDDLMQHQCLLYGREGQYGWKLSIAGKSKIFSVKGPICSNNGEVIKDAAAAGLGIALLPNFIVEKELQAGTLVKILPFCSSPALPINAVYPKHRQHSSFIRDLLSFLTEKIAENSV